MCGDDNRHLGLSGGAIQGNRLAVIEAGGLEALVPLLIGGDPKTAGEWHVFPRGARLRIASMCWIRRCTQGYRGCCSLVTEHAASALAGIMKHEPAIAMVHDLGGTANLVEAYNRSAG